MKYTSIRLTEKTALELKKLQESLSESYEDIIKRLIKNDKGNKNEKK